MAVTDGSDDQNVGLVQEQPPAVRPADSEEASRFYKAMAGLRVDGYGLSDMVLTDGSFTIPSHDLTPPNKNEKPEVADLFGTRIVKFGKDTMMVQDGDGRVEKLHTADGTIELDYDGDSRNVESYKKNGVKYYLKDGTFHYKKDGKEFDTGKKDVIVGADGSFIQTDAKTNNLEVRTRNGSIHILEGATASLDRKGNLTITRGDGSRETLTRDLALIEADAKGHVVEITYPNGDRRNFAYDGDTLVGVKDIDGKILKRENGKWIAEDGRKLEMSNAFVSADGVYSFLGKNDKIYVAQSNGENRKVDHDDLGKDAELYPDPEQRIQEARRIGDLRNKNGGITESGKTIVTDAGMLGLDNVDLFHGSHIVIGGDGRTGDGGALYERWKKLDGAEKRDSSHESSAQQYQLKVGPGDAVVLFGKTADGNTWFQFERHPGRAGNLAEKGFDVAKTVVGNVFDGELSYKDGHGEDYDLYVKIRQNVGPFGVSPHSDRNPVRVNWKPSILDWGPYGIHD